MTLFKRSADSSNACFSADFSIDADSDVDACNVVDNKYFNIGALNTD